MMGKQDDPDDSFLELWKSLKSAANQLAETLSKESRIGKKDIKKVREQIDALKEKHMPDGKFEAMLAVSFCADLIVEQIHYAKGRKKAGFQKLLDSLQKFDLYFDPDKTYEDADGFDMAEDYRTISEKGKLNDRDKQDSM